jgi:hypothetical protein
MLYMEIIAVCSQIHIKHINTLCGQNVELLNVKLAVHIVTLPVAHITWRQITESLTETQVTVTELGLFVHTC